MREETATKLLESLRRLGFSQSGESPNGTMAIDMEYLLERDLGEVLDEMVVRRERVRQGASVHGIAGARIAFDDVAIVVDAVREVVRKLEE
jgi:hypothetical protein